MCTALTWQGKHFYFGRNLDLERAFGERVTQTPRAFGLRFCAQPEQKTHYAMIGMAAAEELFPLYAEAVNERGLCAAGLYFPGNARYGTRQAGKNNVAPHELIAWVLGQCANVAQAELLLQNTNVVEETYGALPAAPLHWMIADRQKCLTIEPRADGLRLFENPVGVLTNNPPFEYHLANLNNYLNVTAAEPGSRFGLPLQPYAAGMGAIGLPGDASSASRFVRAAFYRCNSVCGESAAADVAHFFHILSSVEMIRGGVRLAGGEYDITRYSCCMDADTGTYYLRTYENSRIAAYTLRTEGEKLVQHPLPQGPDFLLAGEVCNGSNRA